MTVHGVTNDSLAAHASCDSEAPGERSVCESNYMRASLIVAQRSTGHAIWTALLYVVLCAECASAGVAFVYAHRQFRTLQAQHPDDR